MDKKQANVFLATILTTVAEIPGTPNGHLYAGLMSRMSFDEYSLLIAICKSGGLMTEEGHTLTVTDKGHELVEKIKEIPGV